MTTSASPSRRGLGAASPTVACRRRSRLVPRSSACPEVADTEILPFGSTSSSLWNSTLRVVQNGGWLRPYGPPRSSGGCGLTCQSALGPYTHAMAYRGQFLSAIRATTVNMAIPRGSCPAAGSPACSHAGVGARRVKHLPQQPEEAHAARRRRARSTTASSPRAGPSAAPSRPVPSGVSSRFLIRRSRWPGSRRMNPRFSSLSAIVVTNDASHPIRCASSFIASPPSSLNSASRSCGAIPKPPAIECPIVPARLTSVVSASRMSRSSAGAESSACAVTSPAPRPVPGSQCS